MARLKVELNIGAVGGLLRSDEMREVLQQEAQKIVNRCGPGYESSARRRPTRQTAAVFARTRAARQDNMDNNTLLKAMR